MGAVAEQPAMSSRDRARSSGDTVEFVESPLFEDLITGKPKWEGFTAKRKPTPLTQWAADKKRRASSRRRPAARKHEGTSAEKASNQLIGVSWTFGEVLTTGGRHRDSVQESTMRDYGPAL